MRMSILLLAVLVTVVLSQNPTYPDCENCPPGRRGPKGEQGKMGFGGEVGEPGDPGRVFFRGTSSKCSSGPCPKGESGNRGAAGNPGDMGDVGDRGFQGWKGEPGNRGVPGEPGLPGTGSGDVMYLPYKPGNNVGQVCYSFRKVCLVPGLRNGWRGWYREGQSGYMIYNRWMYFVTLSECPCNYDKPTVPQPAKPSDCVRLGECQT